MGERLLCPFCGFDVTDVLLSHPGGLVGAVAAIDNFKGLPCCGDVPTIAEVEGWLRQTGEQAHG